MLVKAKSDAETKSSVERTPVVNFVFFPDVIFSVEKEGDKKEKG